MGRYKILSLLLISILIMQTGQQTRYCKYIIPQLHNVSLINSNQKTNLKDWIDFKNGISRFDFSMNAITDKSFHPEESYYAQTIVMFSIFYIVYFLIFLTVFVLIVFCIVFSNRNAKFTKSLKISRSYIRFNYILLVIGSSFFFGGASITIYGNIFTFIGIVSTKNNLKEYGDKPSNFLQEITDSINSINDKTPGTILLENLGSLKSEFNDISQSSGSFADGAFIFELMRFLWIWVQMIIIIIAVIMALLSYLPCRFCGVLVASTIILFALFFEIYFLMSYSASEFFILLDVCEQICNIIELNYLPVTPTGLGYLLKPISYDAQGILTSQLYSAALVYDQYFLQFVTLSSSPNIKTFQEASSIINDPNKGSNSVLYSTYINLETVYNIIQDIFYIRYFDFLLQFSQISELDLCTNSLNMSLFSYIGMAFMILGTIIVIIVQSTLYKKIRTNDLKKNSIQQIADSNQENEVQNDSVEISGNLKVD